MGQQPVDRVFIEMDSLDVQKELDTIVEIDIKKSDKKTPVKTLRRARRALGYFRGVPDFNGTMKVVYLADPEVDWDTLMDTAEQVQLTYEKLGGKRRTLVDLVIDDISEPYKESGETMIDISWTALDDVEEP